MQALRLWGRTESLHCSIPDRGQFPGVQAMEGGFSVGGKDAQVELLRRRMVEAFGQAGPAIDEYFQDRAVEEDVQGVAARGKRAALRLLRTLPLFARCSALSLAG
ncbi:hypothetical protein KDK_48850 [Dictyobacter kobayashii]|uniref:Uncharacterized protein n=1 Tax=Dictyobacter kobayashii TaxID=2014872 RepID=A0A402APX9_9CHLR|nr:hypothetical protein [Dictyobacter kobayashii]GCE21085.1 hypothetical protein KDK_48850 [Dictyobacter kobayashii]